MMQLSSNSELFEYLRSLSKMLEERQDTELSEAVVAHACRMSPFMSTEFLGESRIALKRLLKKEHGVLNSEERHDVKEVLSQIDAAFDRKRYRK